MVTPSRVPGHLSMALQDTLNLFGADVGAAPSGPQAVFAWLHAPGIALAAAAIGLAVWRVPCRADLISDVLAVGLVVNAADRRQRHPGDPVRRPRAGGRPAVRRGAGRADIRPVADQSAADRPAGDSVQAGGGGAGAGGRVPAGRARLRGGPPAAASPEQALAGWLAGRHLTDRARHLHRGQHHHPRQRRRGAAADGLLAPAAAGGTVARLYQSSASWYDPGAGYANFVVTGPADGAADLIPRAEILALAGPPARAYHFESFTIMVWNENLSRSRVPALSRSRRHRPSLTRVNDAIGVESNEVDDSDSARLMA